MLEKLRAALGTHWTAEPLHPSNKRKRDTPASEQAVSPFEMRYPKRRRKPIHPQLQAQPVARKETVVETGYLFGMTPLQTSRYFHSPNWQYIAAIDVGIVNLGICMIRVNADWKCPLVEWIALVDLRTLVEARELSRRTTALLVQYQQLFDKCRYVLIERQPLTGHVAVEQLLFLQLSPRAVLISPNSVHKHLRIGKTHGYKYDDRKDEVVEIAQRYLSAYATTEVYEQFLRLERQHDVGDALCMLLYVLESKRKEAIQQTIV